jgi:hypothetical protein
VTFLIPVAKIVTEELRKMEDGKRMFSTLLARIVRGGVVQVRLPKNSKD